MTLHHADTLTALIKRGMASGLRRSGRISFEWDVSARCTAPVVLELFARGNRYRKFHYGGSSGDRESLRLTMTVPCRQCSYCLSRRSALWRARAEAETRFASRTWFATLTFRPEVHTAAYYAALSRARARASEEDEFKLRCSGLGGELTKYLKRVRKNSGVPLRYLLVPERHKSGLPHFHALFHERDYLRPLRHAVLSDSYGLGFTKFKLVDDNKAAVRYVCKYIAKEAAARVRASLSYGDPARRPLAAMNERPKVITNQHASDVNLCEINDSQILNQLHQQWQALQDDEISRILSELRRFGGLNN